MGVPQTSTRTSHAITIRVDGVTVGMIQQWNTNTSRPANPVYEINAATTGGVLEHVPANEGGQTVQVNRYDLYTKKMEEAWGPSFSMNMLKDQTVPLEIEEKWSNPDGTKEKYVYGGCWFTSLGRTQSATDDRIVKVNATLVYTTKRRFL